MKTMRELWRPRLFKCLLLLVFLTNLGLIEVLQHLLDLPEFTSSISVEDRSKRERELYLFAEGKLTLAKKMISEGQVYSPYHYFADLKSIRDEEERLNVKLIMIGDPVNSLQELVNDGLTKGFFTRKDIEMAGEPYRFYLQGGGKKGKEAIENARQNVRQLGCSGILYWLFLFYLKNMLLVFILYLIWIKEAQKDQKFRFPKPARFSVMLVCYPAVFVRLIWQWFRITQRQIHAEAELRQRKQSLFTFLSEEEANRIKLFAQSAVRFPVWRTQLERQGLKPQHSLAAALLVTFIFMLIPRMGEAEMKVKKDCGQTDIAIEQMLGQHLPRMSIEEGGKSDGQGFGQNTAAAFELCDFLILLNIMIYKEIQKHWEPQEVHLKINHIPISAVRPEVCCFTTLTE